MRRVAHIFLGLMAAMILVGARPAAGQSAAGLACQSSVDGIINPAIADYLTRSVREAEERNCEVLIIRLNTPGGLTTSTWQIGTALLNAKVPTVVYVTPQGANAGSAGVFITYAAHLAAMAPNTNIGAAHPVAGGGEDIGDDLRDKITNDAVARITTWARAHDRNVEWAEEAVRKSVSVGSDEALRLNIINIIAVDERDLLRQLDGRAVALADGQERVLATLNSPIEPIEMSWLESILHLLGDPTIATLLISLGTLGIYFEVANPGLGVGGIIGIIAIGLGLYGLSVLPVNIVGLALLLLGFILFAIDIFATNHGALTIGGIASFVIGALLLIDNDAAPGVAVSKGVIIGIALSMGAIVALVMSFIVRTRGQRDVLGNDGLVGSLVTVRSTIAPRGTVWTQGALWQARADERLETGDEAEVIAVDGLTLIVRHPRVEGAMNPPAVGDGGL